MTRRKNLSITSLLAFATLGIAGKNSFSISDDVLAFPQYEVVFPDDYIFEADAQQRLQTAAQLKEQRLQLQELKSRGNAIQQPLKDTDLGTYASDGDSSSKPDDASSPSEYQEMLLGDQRFLCEIPHVSPNEHAEQINETSLEQEQEVARAKARGLKLLSGMKEGCMYYMAGWWSYSFCYMNEIRQFHALPPGNGVPVYPPVEDKNAKAYVLGRFPPEQQDVQRADGVPSTELAELHSTGDSRYLVQRLGHGTKCDLTDKMRQIEVQFHCHPQSTDRIAYIKETTTCHYLMVIYTPRLCNDVAFQPARQDDANQIVCKQILKPEELAEWEEALEKAKAEDMNEELRFQEEVEGEYPVIDNIRVGGKALLDKDGNALGNGQLAEVIGGEQVELVASSEGGELKKMTKQDYEKVNMTPDELEKFKKSLEKLSQGRPWKLELVTVHGEVTLRALLDAEEDYTDDYNSGKEDEEKEKNRKRKRKDAQEVDEDGTADQGHEQESSTRTSSSSSSSSSTEEGNLAAATDDSDHVQEETIDERRRHEEL